MREKRCQQDGAVLCEGLITGCNNVNPLHLIPNPGGISHSRLRRIFRLSDRAARSMRSVGRLSLTDSPKHTRSYTSSSCPLRGFKPNLCKAAERTIRRLRRRIRRFAATLTARDASNYFRHAGYREIHWNLLHGPINPKRCATVQSGRSKISYLLSHRPDSELIFTQTAFPSQGFPPVLSPRGMLVRDLIDRRSWLAKSA